MADFEWKERRDDEDYILANDVNQLAQGILNNQSNIKKTVNTTEEQDIYGIKNFMEPIRVAGIHGVNVDLYIEGVDSLTLRALYGDLTFATSNGELMFSELLNTLRELTEKVATLESVNQDLENIIELQESYIGGEEE